MSTKLYQTTELGVIPPKVRIFEWPWRVLIYGTPYVKVARILILLSIPGQLLFIHVSDFIHQSRITIGVPFVMTYIVCSTTLLIILLLLAHTIVLALWRFKTDPDSASIPYLTAISDLVGSSFLLGGFVFLAYIGHEYQRPDGATI